MKFDEKINRELMDVELPGIFINNLMVSLDELSLKIYIYIKFLAKNKMNFELEDIAKKFRIKIVELKDILDKLEQEDLVLKTIDGYDILDVKEQEFNKIYIPKLEPKVSKAKNIVEQKRIAAATAINESFFQGIMALSWYVDISTLFEKYCFDEDVMIALFHECNERKALKKNYVFKVAESWYKGGVKTFEQLEDYLNEQEKMNQMKNKVRSKLRLGRALTEYEENTVKNWVNDFKYSFDEIDYAIKKTISIGTPSIGYINGILKKWKESGYNSLADILSAEEMVTKQKLEKETISKTNKPNNLRHKSYEQRKDIDWNQFYDNI